MQPSQLTPDKFAHYPPLGRRLATENLDLLRQLPVALAPLLLQEVSTYDWKFPAERHEIEIQFSYLRALPPQKLQLAMAPFAALEIPSTVADVDWVNSPRIFSEQLSAAFWSSGQVEAFRAASIGYVNAYHQAHPSDTPPISRLTMVVIGQDVRKASFPLFRKLRPNGVYYSAVQVSNAREALMRVLATRARKYPIPYGHWYVDGGEPEPLSVPGITSISYAGLKTMRIAVLDKMRAMGRESRGPEGLQRMMQQLDPSQFNHVDAETDPVMKRFHLSIFSEGSGTQFYSTTFAEWAAHELLRRAQPATVLVRFAPRQIQRSFDEMILDLNGTVTLDPDGSLLDADMGAFYIWLNQRRLPNSDKSAFLVWFENHAEAVMIAPHLSAGTESREPLSFDQLLQSVAEFH